MLPWLLENVAEVENTGSELNNHLDFSTHSALPSEDNLQPLVSLLWNVLRFFIYKRGIVIPLLPHFILRELNELMHIASFQSALKSIYCIDESDTSRER